MGKGMKKSKVILVVSVVVVALVVGAIAFFSVNALQASYDSALPSYTEKNMDKMLGSSENPYTILEIVPDEESAALGYLISGQEPQNLKAIGSTDLNNPNSAAAIYKAAFESSEVDSENIAQVKDRVDSYIFDGDKSSVGVQPESGYTPKTDGYISEVSPGDDMAYSEFGYFTKVDNGKGAYNYDAQKKCFVPYAGGNYTWTSIGEFQHVGIGQVPQGSVPCARTLDNSQGEKRGYTYDSSESSGAIGERAFKYDYSPMGDFAWVPNNYYNNEDIFRENATETEINAAKVGDKLYMTRTEKEYFVYKSSLIICNDIPIKFLVGPDATAMKFKTQIVSVTPKQLSNKSEAGKAEDLINTCDAIYVHNSAIGYKIADALKPPSSEEEGDKPPRNFDKSSTSGDLSDDIAKCIIERGAEGVSKDAYGQVTKGPAAIIFDEEAIEKANSYVNGYGKPDSTKNCSNLKLIYDVYNNLGAKLAYNWKLGSNYSNKITEASNQQGYRNFSYNEIDALGKSQFVYNYTGEDDSWLTTDFGNESKVAKTALNEPAFDDVSTFINQDCGNSMSVAKMFMAINLEADAYNQPDHLRILELEPNTKYIYDNSDPTNQTKKDYWVYYYLQLFPWFAGTDRSIDNDLTITAMPTWEFIGKNEDVNENYDMIIVGNNEPDETNGKYGYNDPYLQIPLPTEVGGDGVTPCPVSYTAVGDLITTYGYHRYPVDEKYEKDIEDYDNPSNYNSWTGARTNTDEGEPRPDSSRSTYSYKWKYGLFRDNRWYNTKNVKALRDKTYNIGFSRNFIREIVGTGDADDWQGLAWWYQKTRNPVYGTKHGSDANMVGLRYSGNDLTKKKFDQLLDFSTQAPLIVADDLYWQYPGWSEYASAYKIDQSSFIYKLANMNSDADSTVHKYTNSMLMNKNANDVKGKMLRDKLTVEFTNDANGQPGTPVEYNQNDDTYNQQRDNAGNNVLRYHFTINGDPAAAYRVNVYTDSNGNGIFEGCKSHMKEVDASIEPNTKEYEDATDYYEGSTTLRIFDETDKYEVNENDIRNGALVNNHTYLVTKIMPPSEVGMIPWKLELYKQGDDSIRYSQVGYTRIPAKERTLIKVLQMNPNPNMSGNGFDDLSVCFANHYRFKLDNWYGSITPNATFINNQEMSNLYSEQYVKDFNIQVDFMDNDYWMQVYGGDKEKWSSALMEYDMIIIGFKDMAKFTNNENYIYGFEKFREAGKSVILSHDLCEDASMGIMDMTDNSNTDSIIQSDVRYYLRDISGQLRKYYKADADEEHKNEYSYLDYNSRGRALSFEPSDYFKIFTSIREYKTVGLGDTNVDYLMQNDSNKTNTPIYDKHTYTYGVFGDSNYTYDNNQKIWLNTPINAIREYYDKKDGALDGIYTNKPAGIIQDNSTRSMLYYSTINYNRNNNSFLDKLDRAVNLDRKDLVWQTSTFATNKVQSVNEGQITKYPYEIPKTLDVAQTHTQNYQLDLEYDEEGDVLIWYNLAGGGIYQGRNQDCRNDYYIYTKGNITYTGVGHSGGLTENEKKLFVNTMVASYRSSASDPYITILNPDVTNNMGTMKDSSGQDVPAGYAVMYVEERDGLAESAYGSYSPVISYRIDDDTTNSKIEKEYALLIYKDGQLVERLPVDVDDPAQKLKKGDVHTITVPYNDILTSPNKEVDYMIILNSSYELEGKEVNKTYVQNVKVALMPLFGLR